MAAAAELPACCSLASARMDLQSSSLCQITEIDIVANGMMRWFRFLLLPQQLNCASCTA